MNKLTHFIILILALLLTSCATMPDNSTSMTNYYGSEVDLSKVIFEGGDGKTIETSVIIRNAGNERTGIAAEYDYIAKKLGKKSQDWIPVSQSITSENGKMYDVIDVIIIPANENITFYFDITDFYGKF